MNAAKPASPPVPPAPDSAELTPRDLVRGMAWSIVLNSAIPVILYKLSLRYISPSELAALIVATLYPIAESVWGLSRHRSMDPIGLMVLAGIIVDAAAITLGGSPKLLLIRESFVTGAFGVACFVSLFLRRPLMFYFGRYFMTGNDPVKRARFEASYALPEVRHGNRLVTSIWGIVFCGELAIRIVLVYTLTPAAVLVISPLILGALSIAVAVWSLAYAARMRRRVLPILLASTDHSLP